MGCDIHLAVEQRTEQGWVRCEELTQARWSTEPDLVRERWYEGRSYPLFAMLAGVRNPTGRGDDWGAPVAPIAEPRGLPNDASPVTIDESDEWGVDGHSHSFFTLAELLAVNWSQMLTRCCWVRRLPALPPGWRKDDSPDQYAARLQEAARALRRLPLAESWHFETCLWSSAGQGTSGWRSISWSEPWFSAVDSDWWGCVTRMARLAGDDLSSVRIVFWFDN